VYGAQGGWPRDPSALVYGLHGRWRMPYSYPDLREQIEGFLVKRAAGDTPVVDVGAGAGAYADLLGPHFSHLIAIEIWSPYIDTFDLASKYDEIIEGDVRAVEDDVFAGAVVILGDVFEHFCSAEAIDLLARVQRSAARLVVIVVPYLYEQGADHPGVLEHGNPHEVHLQPDLTHEIFLARYPSMQLLARNQRVGAYYWDARDLGLTANGVVPAATAVP
jgi:hypothetical protein